MQKGVKEEELMTDGADFSRRHMMALGLLGLVARPGFAAAALGLPRLGRASPFSWDGLLAEAKKRAAQTYVKPRSIAAAAAVDYDALNFIQYRDDAELWPKSPSGAVRFFPVSRYAREPIRIYAVENGMAREVRFSIDLFRMPANSPGRKLVGDDGGFAGFRVMNPSGVGDWLAYQGASYFRSAGPLDQYGLSARALALDTAIVGPEEFPFFHSFWLERQGATIIVYALLESPRSSGVWRFVTGHDGKTVVQDVTARFQLRGDVERLGIAPLTSMYWYGETEQGPRIDWRPEVHDSDGLLMLTGSGERIWRPLVNPPAVQVNAFADKGPKGFGLMQRDRAYENYEDDGVFYHRRPSLWVEPQGDWGEGAVELVELPTHGETEDNIVAFWRPKAPAKSGNTYDFSYRLAWTDKAPETMLAQALFTRRGLGGRPGHPPQADVVKLVIDFEGDVLKGRGRDSGVTADVTVTRGQLLQKQAYPVVGRENQWRLMIDVKPDPGAATDLRASLAYGGAQLTETWLYQLHG